MKVPESLSMSLELPYPADDPHKTTAKTALRCSLAGNEDRRNESNRLPNEPFEQPRKASSANKIDELRIKFGNKFSCGTGQNDLEAIIRCHLTSFECQKRMGAFFSHARFLHLGI